MRTKSIFASLLSLYRITPQSIFDFFEDFRRVLICEAAFFSLDQLSADCFDFAARLLLTQLSLSYQLPQHFTFIAIMAPFDLCLDPIILLVSHRNTLFHHGHTHTPPTG